MQKHILILELLRQGATIIGETTYNKNPVYYLNKCYAEIFENILHLSYYPDFGF